MTHNVFDLESGIELGVLGNVLLIPLVDELVQGLAVEGLSHNFFNICNVNKGLDSTNVVHTTVVGFPHKVGQENVVKTAAI